MKTKGSEIAEKVKEAPDQEFFFQTPEEHDEYLNNFTETQIEKKLGDRIGKVYGDIDKDIFETVGREKKPGEKTYDFLKRTLGEFKEKSDGVSVYEAQIKELNDKLRNNSGDETLKSQYKTLEKKHKEALDRWTEEKEGLEQKYTTFKVESSLNNSIAGMKFRKDLPEAVVKSYVDTVKNELTGNAVFKDDRLLFKQGDEILIDKDTMKPLTAQDILADRLKDIIDKGGKSGTGTGQNDTGAASGEIVPPDSALVDNDSLAAWLQDYLITNKGYSKGQVRGSKEYLEIFGKYRKK